jgi:RNase P/RNase MRP subunit p29
LLSLTVVVGLSVAASAQTKKECDGIVGRLTTDEGWVIVDVTIRAVNKTTKQALETKTDSYGEYVVCLPPGTYDVFASMLGFRPAKRKSVPVAAKSRNIIDFTLKRGKPIVVDGAHP